MKKHKKIAWQKYEDVIETQLNSPIANSLISSFLGTNEPIDLPSVEDEEDRIIQDQFMVSIPESLSNEIYLITNFDCWIGHTNFDITETIKKQMNKIEGIEVLKICSRYRFFIGIGQLFSFKDIRKNIEQELINRKNS